MPSCIPASTLSFRAARFESKERLYYRVHLRMRAEARERESQDDCSISPGGLSVRGPLQQALCRRLRRVMHERKGNGIAIRLICRNGGHSRMPEAMPNWVHSAAQSRGGEVIGDSSQFRRRLIDGSQEAAIHPFS